jgi:hypothetical protein
MRKPVISIWSFEDAPKKYQRLSEHGGDEDWLAFIPEQILDRYMPFLESPTFGCCEVSVHPVPGGEVRIGAHA